jgi:hypothetical protein
MTSWTTSNVYNTVNTLFLLCRLLFGRVEVAIGLYPERYGIFVVQPSNRPIP